MFIIFQLPIHLGGPHGGPGGDPISGTRTLVSLIDALLIMILVGIGGLILVLLLVVLVLVLVLLLVLVVLPLVSMVFLFLPIVATLLVVLFQ